MFCVYILYSEILSSYYIGETEDLKSRIDQHNLGFYVSAFTKKASDWKLYYVIRCSSRSQARRIEAHIKRMKSKKYLNNLKKFPEIAMKLKNNFI